MGQGPCHRMSPSFRSERVKDRERWSDGDEDRGAVFRLTEPQMESDDNAAIDRGQREEERRGEKKGGKGEAAWCMEMLRCSRRCR